MGRHGPSGAQRCRAMRLRGRQPRRLDAALPRHESSDDGSDDHPARRMSGENQTKESEMSKNIRITALLALTIAPLPALAAPIQAILYKNPQCTCCDKYADYLRANGF